MNAYDKAVTLILRHEGGYVNHPNDPGGETNMGISKRAYPDLDIKNLTVDHVKQIYKTDYWDKVKGDELPPAVALVCFDVAVLSGPRKAAKMLQKAVGANPDGIIGNITLACVEDEDPNDIIDNMSEQRIAFYKGLKHWDTFGRGWSRRVNETKEEAKGWIKNS